MYENILHGATIRQLGKNTSNALFRVTIIVDIVDGVAMVLILACKWKWPSLL